MKRAVSDHHRGSDVGLQQVKHLHGGLQAPLGAVGQHVLLPVDAPGLETSNFHLVDFSWKLKKLSWDLAYPDRKSSFHFFEH